MPKGTEVQRCTAYRGNRWVCSYIVWLKCGCRYNRYTITVTQETEPTHEEVLKAIAENEDTDQ